MKEMTEIFTELAVVGAKLDEEDRIVQFLASLPESYNTLVTALEANEKVPSMEVVVDRLIHEERKLKDRQSDTGSEGALITKNKPRDGLGRVRCYCCGKIGHMQKDCFERDKRSKLTAKK